MWRKYTYSEVTTRHGSKRYIFTFTDLDIYAEVIQCHVFLTCLSEDYFTMTSGESYSLDYDYIRQHMEITGSDKWCLVDAQLKPILNRGRMYEQSKEVLRRVPYFMRMARALYEKVFPDE